VSAEPALSVIYVADALDTIRKTVRRVAAQGIAKRIEVVVVVPRGIHVSADDSDLAPLWGMQRVEIDSIDSMEWGRAPGIAAARAPVVVLGESHSFPEPGWAEALLAPFGEGWAAVGPVIRNANPSDAASWANLLLDYGPWLGGERREVSDLPGHNSAYRRAFLLELGDELPLLLEAEYLLHARLRARGHRLLLQPDARVRHLNLTRLGSILDERFNGGRRFAAARARSVSPLRRLAYVIGSPLIPAVRVRRILRDVQRFGLRAELAPHTLIWLLLGVVVATAGEVAGYVAGTGRSMARLARMELHKEHYLGNPNTSAETT
jgi:Glycosyltransferase like family 2